MLTGLFKNVRFGPPPNLHSCIAVAGVCRFVQCLKWRFLPIQFFFPASFCAFTGAPHSRFWCRDFKLCSLHYFKMLQLALFFKSTHVYFMCRSLSLCTMPGFKILAHLHLFSHWGGFARLAMRDTRVVGAGFPTSAYLTF